VPLLAALPASTPPAQRQESSNSDPESTEPPHLPKLTTSAAIAFGLADRADVAGGNDRVLPSPDWGISDQDLANAALLDNTTIVTVRELVHVGGSGRLLTPVTILDLATFVEAVITRERIFHLDNPEVNTEELNRIFGEDVFITLPSDNMSKALERMWFESFNTMVEFRRLNIQAPEPTAEMTALLDGWTSLIGRKMTIDDIVSPDEGVRWESSGRQLLRQLALAMSPVKFYVGLFSEREAPYAARQTISECNHRGYFNERVSLSLGVPYAANTARMPIQRVRYMQGCLNQKRLSAMKVLEGHHKKVSEAYGSASVQLPFFLSVLLSRTTDLGSFMFGLAEMRRAASDFRRRRLDLDKAVAAADSLAITDLNRALSNESTDWISLGFGALIPVGSSILASCAAGPPSLLIAAAATVVGAIGGIPAGNRAGFVRRLFRPQFRFLNDMASQSRAILDVRGHLDRLWGPEPWRDRILEERLGNIAAMSSR